MSFLRPSCIFRGLLLTALLACASVAARAQNQRTQPAAAQAVHAVLLSDIHLDPFHDPAKAQRLYDAPIDHWAAILSEPDSPGREADYSALQKKCNGNGNGDSPYALFASALNAAHQNAPGARFVTVTGDMVVHTFDCRFQALLPQYKGPQYRAFVEKTERFVAGELRRTFPGVPIYATLGNNDSDCGDYRLSPGGEFLRDLAPLFIDDLALAKGRDRAGALTSFAARGDYNLPLPAPLQHARIVSLDDVFLATNYSPCQSKDSDAAPQQIRWLRAQLTEARRQHQQVWVMGHMPPGVDLFSTVTHARDVCAGQAPFTFLTNDELDQALLSGGGVIRLALFAHTHMDEMRLLRQAKGPASGDVPIKMVSSISPINGNAPSITLGTVQPATATLVNYAVLTASNRTGIGTKWEQRYTYSQAYHEPAFDGPSLDKLTAKFLADRTGSTPESQNYIRSYYVGLGSTLTPLWPAYVCSITHTTAQSYTACTCQNNK